MNTHRAFLHFLENDLSIPTDALALAMRQVDQISNLPMVLWQYGLVTLRQLELIFDWIEQGY